MPARGPRRPGSRTTGASLRAGARQEARQRARLSTATTLVCGPPCAGKNTYVAEHAERGDLIVDLDALIGALSGTGSHDQPAALKPLALDARDAVLNRLWSGKHDVSQAWVILSAPTQAQRRRFRARGCRIVMVTADAEVLHRRAVEGRPDIWAGYIDEWLADHDQLDVDELVDTTPDR